jgi:hypothetical protein
VPSDLIQGDLYNMPTNMKFNDTQLRNLKPADKVKRLSDGFCGGFLKFG